MYCTDRLTAAGFSVAEQPFAYSQFPAKWEPSIVGALLAVISLVAGHLAVGHHMPVVALLFALICAVKVGVGAGALYRKGPLGLRWSRAESVNLVAMRMGAPRRPRIWLVAHLDSKSQTIPMLLRMAAVGTFAVMFAALIAALIAMSLDPDTWMRGVNVLSILAAISALPLVFCFIGNESNGAADNASGVASVLLAAEMLGQRDDVGLVLTSAEEFALAGARAFVHSSPDAGGTAINCDTIDDDGHFICMAKGHKPRPLDAAIDRAASRMGIETLRPVMRSRRLARLRGMLPGVLADNIAFSDAGWSSFTLSRGNLRTLGRVHTSRDRADSITGTGIAMAARLIAATVEELD